MRPARASLPERASRQRQQTKSGSKVISYILAGPGSTLAKSLVEEGSGMMSPSKQCL